MISIAIIIRVKTDSDEVNKKGKKLAHRYTGKYEVVKILSGGWSYRL